MVVINKPMIMMDIYMELLLSNSNIKDWVLKISE